MLLLYKSCQVRGSYHFLIHNWKILERKKNKWCLWWVSLYFFLGLFLCVRVTMQRKKTCFFWCKCTHKWGNFLPKKIVGTEWVGFLITPQILKRRGPGSQMGDGHPTLDHPKGRRTVGMTKQTPNNQTPSRCATWTTKWWGRRRTDWGGDC